MILGKAAQAPSGAMFFDCDVPLNNYTLAAFKAHGFTGAGRYLSRVIGQNPGDLSPNEARAILGNGLAIVPVQHVSSAGWSPTQAKGTEYGRAAAWNASSVGCPAGVNVWLDLESVSPDASPADVIAYCEAWFAEVRKALFVPGLYVGVSPGLDPTALYEALSVTHYWHAGSKSAPLPAVRGVQIMQHIAGQIIAGVGYDGNTIQKDAKGDLPFWWVKT